MLTKMSASTEESVTARISGVIRHAQMHLQLSKGLHSGMTIATLKAFDHVMGEFVELEAHSYNETLSGH